MESSRSIRIFRVVFGLLVTALGAYSFGADIDIGDSNVSMPAGDSLNNYTFLTGTTGYLEVADGARQYGSITLERDAELRLSGSAELLRTDSGRGVSDAYLNLGTYRLSVVSGAPADPEGPPLFFQLWEGAITGSGTLFAPNHEVGLIAGDSGAATASITAYGLSIQCPDADLPGGTLTAYSHIILNTANDYTTDFHCEEGLSFFANVSGSDYEITYNGQFIFDDPDPDYAEDDLQEWGRAVAFTAPTRLTDHSTVTYFVGPDTFNQTDSIAVCGGCLNDAGDRVVYGTLKVNDLSWLKNDEGNYLNLGFAGGMLDLRPLGAGSTIDFVADDVMIGSVGLMDLPGGGIFVLPSGAQLLLKAENLRLDKGPLEVQGSSLEIVLDCRGTDLGPGDFGGFKLPADATLRFITDGDTVATGNLEGEGTVDAGGKNLALGSDSNDESDVPESEKQFNGTIQDAAAITKVGAGTTTLGSGASVAADAATVTDGTLVLNTHNFSLDGGAGALNVDGGVLMGRGTIGGDLVIGSGGAYQPGTSIDIQAVSGDFSLSGDMEIEVRPMPTGKTESTPGMDSDCVRVTQAARFESGATIAVLDDPDFPDIDPYKAGDKYYFLVSEANDVGGIDALTFTDDIPDLRVGDYGLTDADTTVGLFTGKWLWVELEPGTFYGSSYNTNATAALLDQAVSLGVAGALTSQLESLDRHEQTLGLEQVAGESIGTGMVTTLQNTTMVSMLLGRRIRPKAFSVGSGSGHATGMAGDAVVRGQDACLAGCGPAVGCCPCCSLWTVWSTGYGVGGRFFGDANTNRSSVSTGGLLVGLERPLASDAKVGLYYAYGHAYTDVSGIAATTRTDDHLWGGYFVYDGDGHYAVLSGGLGYDSYESRRVVETGTLWEQNVSNHAGWQSLVQAEYGLEFSNGCTALEPHVGLQYVYLRQNGFTESTSGLVSPLAVDAVDHASLRTVLGTRVSHRLRRSAFAAVAEFRAAWLHELLDRTAPLYTASLAIAPEAGSFTAAGADLGRDWGWLGGGMKWKLASNFTVGCDYDLMLNANQTLHTGSGSLTVLW